MVFQVVFTVKMLNIPWYSIEETRMTYYHRLQCTTTSL